MLLFLSGGGAEFVDLECVEDSMAVGLGGVEDCHASEAFLLLAALTGFDPISGV
jgi:hypothetical protein